jgi:hypothetical protein
LDTLAQTEERQNLRPAVTETEHARSFDMKPFLYKSIAIYPDLSGIAATLTQLEATGFGTDQISLLGRQSAHINENLELERETYKTVEGTVFGAALGTLPGLALVAGVAVTGGLGLIAAGPLVPALMATGLGALAGGITGGFMDLVDAKESQADVEAEVEAAILSGHWVLVVHSRSKEEAQQAQGLLEQGRGVLETVTTSELEVAVIGRSAPSIPEPFAAAS